MWVSQVPGGAFNFGALSFGMPPLSLPQLGDRSMPPSNSSLQLCTPMFCQSLSYSASIPCISGSS
jgi:hypothetical protein